MKNIFYFNAAFFLGLSILSPPIFAKLKVCTPHSFIATASNDPSIRRYKEMTKSMDNALAINMFYLDKIELRAGVDDLEDPTQTYQLRFYPRAWGELKYNRLLSKAVEQAEKLEQDFYLGEALKCRYRLVLEYIQNAKLLTLNKALEIVFTDRVSVLHQKIAKQVSSDISKLISTEDKLQRLRFDLVELESQKAMLDASIHRIAGSSIQIVFTENAIIHMDKIETLLKYLNPDPENSLYLRRLGSKATQAEYKVNIEKAKNSQYISYFQIGQDVDDRDEWPNRTSLEIGIQLPVLNSDREKNWRLKSDLMQKKFDYMQEKNATRTKSTQLLSNIKVLLSHYKRIDKNIDKGYTATGLIKQMTLKGIDPLDLLQLKESTLKNDISRNQTAFLIRTQFIELMDMIGRLTQKPLTNYLSNDMEKLL